MLSHIQSAVVCIVSFVTTLCLGLLTLGISGKSGNPSQSQPSRLSQAVKESSPSIGRSRVHAPKALPVPPKLLARFNRRRDEFIKKECESVTGQGDYDGDLVEGFENPFEVSELEECIGKCEHLMACRSYKYVRKTTSGTRNMCHLLSHSTGILMSLPYRMKRHVTAGWCQCPPNGCWHTKLVISTVPGSRHLRSLLYSLYAQSFESFADVIIVLGVDDPEECAPPTAHDVSEFLRRPGDGAASGLNGSAGGSAAIYG